MDSVRFSKLTYTDLLKMPDRELAEIERFARDTIAYNNGVEAEQFIKGIPFALGGLFFRPLEMVSSVYDIITATDNGLNAASNDFANQTRRDVSDILADRVQQFPWAGPDNGVANNFDGNPENDTRLGEDLVKARKNMRQEGFESLLDDWREITRNPFDNPPASPLVLDLDGDGIELTWLAESTAYFDLDVNGFAERTGWVAADDGLLALDVNGNGAIDSGAELFGDQTGYAHGFLALAAHDANRDGVIDARDQVYDNLLIWRDLDGDGYSTTDELTRLEGVGVSSVGKKV